MTDFSIYTLEELCAGRTKLSAQLHNWRRFKLTAQALIIYMFITLGPEHTLLHVLVTAMVVIAWMWICKRIAIRNVAMQLLDDAIDSKASEYCMMTDAMWALNKMKYIL